MNIWNQLRVDYDSKIPLVSQLSQQLKWLIASGQIKPDSKLPSVRLLGEQLGISFHTVRAAYQEIESEGLVSTRHGIGTIVLPVIISALSRKRSNVPSYAIGVIIPAYTDFYGPVLQGIQNASREDPSLFFICDSHEDSKLAEYYLDQLIARGVDGIVMVSSEINDLDKPVYINENPDAFPPVVFADLPTYPHPLVLFDLEEGAYQAARHILAHGHQRVGVITPPIEWLNIGEINRGYQRGFNSAGLSLSPDLVIQVPDYELESGYTAAQQFMGMEDSPTALLAAADMLAIGAIKAIKERGLRVPDDIAIIGYGELELSALIEPPLTTIFLPAYEMGVKAYEMLRRTIDGDYSGHSPVILRTELNIRNSCGCNG